MKTSRLESTSELALPSTAKLLLALAVRDRTPEVHGLVREFTALRYSNVGSDVQSWDVPEVERLAQPLVAQTRAALTAKGISFTEATDQSTFEHRYPVFVIPPDHSPLGAVSARCQERFGYTIGIDPVGLALRKAHALHLDNRFLSLGVAEIILGQPTGSAYHEMYHAAAKTALDRSEASPDRLSCSPRPRNRLHVGDDALVGSHGSEIFAASFAATTMLARAPSEPDRFIARCFMNDAASSTSEALRYCGYFRAALREGSLRTLALFETLARERMVELDTKHLAERGVLKLSQSGTGYPRPWEARPCIRIICRSHNPELPYRTVQLSGADDGWRVNFKMNGDRFYQQLDRCTERISQRPEISGSELVQTPEFHALRTSVVKEARELTSEVYSMENFLWELRDLTTQGLRGNGVDREKLACVNDRITELYPELSAKCL